MGRVSHVEVVRESEYDDTEREWWLGYHRFKAGLCRGCGTHFTIGHDATTARNVEHELMRCEDCAAVETARAKWHKDNAHDEKSCDCADQAFFITDRPKVQPVQTL